MRVFALLAGCAPLLSPTIAEAQSPRQVGQTLRINTDGIMDQDGLTNPNWRFQWIRVDGATETNIPGATMREYTIVAADLGKKLKVRVTFTDDLGNTHSLSSALTAAVTAAVSLSASPNPVTEGSSVTVTARLSAVLTANATIPITLTAGTADPGDYGTLTAITVTAGSLTGTGTILTNHDDDTENETFTVSLGTPLPALTSAHRISARRQVQVTIADDEGALYVDADMGSQLIFHGNMAHTNYISVLNSAEDKAVTVLVQYYNDEMARVLWYLRVLRGGANVLVDPFDHLIPGTADEKGENGTHVGDFLGELPAASFTEKGGKFRPGVNSGRFLIVVTAVGAHSVDEDGDSTNTANTANILFPDFLAAGMHGTDNIDNCGNISLDGMGLGYTGNGPEGEFDCRKEDPDTPENEGDETTKNVGPLTVRNYDPVAFNYLLGHHTAAQVSSETGGVSWGVNALVRAAFGPPYTVLDGTASARLAPKVHGGVEGENAATDDDNLADDSGGVPVTLDPTPSENNRVVNGGTLVLSSLSGGADENQRVEFLSAADDYGDPGEYQFIAAKTLYKVVLHDAMGNVLRIPSLVEPVFGGLPALEPPPGLHILVDGLGVLPNASPEDCSGHERVEGWSLADLTGIVPSATKGTGDFTGLGARVDPATNASRGRIEFQRTRLTCTEDFGDGDPSTSAIEIPDGVPTQDKRSFIGGTLVVEKGRENRTFVTAGQLVLKFRTPNSAFAASWWLTRK